MYLDLVVKVVLGLALFFFFFTVTAITRPEPHTRVNFSAFSSKSWRSQLPVYGQLNHMIHAALNCKTHDDPQAVGSMVIRAV